MHMYRYMRVKNTSPAVVTQLANSESDTVTCQLNLENQTLVSRSVGYANNCPIANRQHSRTTACALMSDRGYLLIQAFFLLGICYDPNLSKQL